MYEVSISNQIRLSYNCVDCDADSEEDIQIVNASIGCLGDGSGLLSLTLLSREPLPEKQIFFVMVANDIMAEAIVYTVEQEPVESRNSELVVKSLVWVSYNFLSAKL